MKLRPEEVILLATANVFCLLLYFFAYSSISLFFLFCSFLLTLGIGLHLFYMSTSQDEYLDRLAHKSDKGRKLSDREKAMAKVEFVPPSVIVAGVLKAYGLLLALRRHYIDIVTLRDGTVTKRWFLWTPIALVIMYYLRIADTFVLWVTLNYLILRKVIRQALNKVPAPDPT